MIPNKFEIDFVHRTKKLLLEYEGPYGMSNLINCSLGLIILPYETLNRNKPNKIWTTNLDLIPNLPTFTIRIFDPIKEITKDNKTIHYDKTLKVLLKKIRNGIAHQNIIPQNKYNVFSGIVVKNNFRTILDTEIEFTQQQFKEFALFIADSYLETIS